MKIFPTGLIELYLYIATIRYLISEVFKATKILQDLVYITAHNYFFILEELENSYNSPQNFNFFQEYKKI